jgi:hypothetical protein
MFWMAQRRGNALRIQGLETFRESRAAPKRKLARI